MRARRLDEQRCTRTYVHIYTLACGRVKQRNIYGRNKHGRRPPVRNSPGLSPPSSKYSPAAVIPTQSLCCLQHSEFDWLREVGFRNGKFTGLEQCIANKRIFAEKRSRSMSWSKDLRMRSPTSPLSRVGEGSQSGHRTNRFRRKDAYWRYVVAIPAVYGLESSSEGGREVEDQPGSKHERINMSGFVPMKRRT